MLKYIKKTFARALPFIEKLKWEYIFVALAVPWGLGQLILTPPNIIPDESSHLYRSWGIANLQWKCEQGSKVQVPVSLIDLHSSFKQESIESGMFSFRLYKPFHTRNLNENGIPAYTQFCSYNPITHLPQAIGLFIAKILNSSVITGFYLARFFNLLVSVLLIFFAIKITPLGKIFFFFAGLLPPTIQQISSLSGDALHLSGLILFTSLIIYFSKKESLKTRDSIILLLLSLLLIQLKPGYIGFIILFFLLNKNQFKNTKTYFFSLFIFILANLSLFLFFSLSADTQNYLRPAGVDPQKQLQFIANSPFLAIKTICADIFNNFKKYQDAFYGQLKHISLVIIIFLLLASNNDPRGFRLKQRLFLAGTFIFTITMIFSLEYVFWTAPEAEYVAGIQDRYFIALFPIFLLIFHKIKIIKYTIPITLQQFIAIIIILIFISSLTGLRGTYFKEYFTEPPIGNEQVLPFLPNDYVQIYGLDKSPDLENKYLITEKSPYIKIKTSEIEGFSFNSDASGLDFSYFVSKDGINIFNKKKDGISDPAFINFNVGAFEKKYDSNLKYIQITLSSKTIKKKELIFSNFKIYK